MKYVKSCTIWAAWQEVYVVSAKFELLAADKTRRLYGYSPFWLFNEEPLETLIFQKWTSKHEWHQGTVIIAVIRLEISSDLENEMVSKQYKKIYPVSGSYPLISSWFSLKIIILWWIPVIFGPYRHGLKITGGGFGGLPRWRNGCAVWGWGRRCRRREGIGRRLTSSSGRGGSWRAAGVWPPTSRARSTGCHRFRGSLRPPSENTRKNHPTLV